MKLKTVIIGAGNVASHISKALSSEVDIVQIFSNTLSNSKDLGYALGCSNCVDSYEDVIPNADLYIISIKDDAIESAIQGINCTNPNALWLHTSGSKPMDVFSGIRNNYGVLYPLQTFSKNVPLNMEEVPLFIEANSENTLEDIKNIAKLISPKIYEADSNSRKTMHIAAVFGCNFVNHLWSIADDILKKDNLPFEVLLPLLQATLDKVKSNSPKDSQTGPASRGDREIIENHLNGLSGTEKDIYKLLSESIIEKTKK